MTFRIEIPKTIFGKDTKKELERVLAEKDDENIPGKPETHVGAPTPGDLKNPEDYIFLEGRSHGDYSYPDLNVCKYRLGASSDVQRTGQGIGLNLQNTAKEQNGRDYAGNINHAQALKLNLVLGGLTLSVRQFADFLNLLKSKKAFDARGNKIAESELEAIFNEITQVRNPWRSEWLDGDFRTDNKGIISIYTSHALDASGNLIPRYKRELTDSLMEKKTPGIDFNDWLARANKYGLPTTSVRNGSLYYWAPDKDNNSVARFGALSGGAGLDCNWDRDGTGASLGVRHARPRVRQKISR